jgi:hypothetical protein
VIFWFKKRNSIKTPCTLFPSNETNFNAAKMRIKKTNTILGTAVLVGGVTFLYLFLQDGSGGGSALYGNPEAQKVRAHTLLN